MSKPVKVMLAVVAVAAVAFCVASYALDRYLLGQTYARRATGGPTLTLTDADIADDYPMKDVSFSMDGQTLRGHVYGSENNRGLVVFRHGIFSHHQDYLAYITALVDRGWTVFAYDALGCGESDGDSVIGFAQSPRDVHAAVQFARESGMADGLPVLLFGHSWGGYGVAGALAYDDGVSACVTMSGFDVPSGIIMESAESQMGPVAMTQRPFIDLIGLIDFGKDADRSASRAIDESGVPTLVVHGTGDGVISYGGASIIAQRERIANPDVSYVTLDTPGRNGHNTYFYSPESQEYLDECSRQLAALEDEYGGDAPDGAISDFLTGIDKRRANTADPDLVGRIDEFFTEAVAG